MAGYRSGRRSGGYRSGGVRRSAGTRARSRRSVSAPRRRVSSRRTSGGGTRTVRLVIEQAAPAVQPVIGENGAFAVPDNSVPKRAKF